MKMGEANLSSQLMHFVELLFVLMGKRRYTSLSFKKKKIVFGKYLRFMRLIYHIEFWGISAGLLLWAAHLLVLSIVGGLMKSKRLEDGIVWICMIMEIIAWYYASCYVSHNLPYLENWISLVQQDPLAINPCPLCGEMSWL